MIIRFADNNIKRICSENAYARKKLPAGVVDTLQKLLYELSAQDRFDSFYKVPIYRKYKAHQLKGHKKGIIAMSLNYSYRMELLLEIERIDNKDVVKILEVSNHYGD